MTAHGTGVDMATLMRQDRDRFVAFAFASADILLEINDKADILFADGATSSLLGVSPQEMKKASLLGFIDDSDRKHAEQLVTQMRMLQRIDRLKIRLKGRDNKVSAFAVSGYKLPYMENHIFLTFSLLRADMNVEEIGKRDLYSGLLKEKAFAEAAIECLKHHQGSEKSVLLTMVDFPEIEEWLQHATQQQAEALLDEICHYLKGHALEKDAAGNFETGTYGLLHDQQLSTRQILTDIQAIAEKHTNASGDMPSFRLKSLLMDTPGLSHQDGARAIQYTINRFSQNNHGDFDLASLSDGYKAMLDETVRKITVFKKTIHDNSFEVAFQPIADLKDRSVHHYEVLVRFKEQTEFQNPFQFITFGEEAGIIADFDLAMCQRSISILEKAYEVGRKPFISINLSGNSISSDLFRDTLLRILDMHDTVRRQIIFEVTESAKIHDLDVANKFLQQLRKSGNLCCLDDFGVGESSFDYLRKLEIDFVKIDGSYVRDCLNSPRGMHLCKAMIDLCNDLDITTIGEMIEDEKVALFLADCGVEFGQGYYLGKPTTDIEPLIRSFPHRELPCLTLPKRRSERHRKGLSRRWSEHIVEA